MDEPLKGLLTPPALVKASTAEMDQLGFEASAAIERGLRHSSGVLDEFRTAGEMIVKAKANAKHGEWLPWLDKHQINHRRASEAIRVFENWQSAAPGGSLKKALRLISDKVQEQQEIKEDRSHLFCRHCRMNGPQKDCKECARVRGEKPKKEGRKSGGAIFSIKPVNKCIGTLAKVINGALEQVGSKAPDTARGFTGHLIDTPEAAGLRRRLQEGKVLFDGICEDFKVFLANMKKRKDERNGQS